MSDTFLLSPGELSLADLRLLDRSDRAIVLSPSSWAAVDQGRDVVVARIASGTPTYGVNTGLGSLASHLIPQEDIGELQRRLVLSNAAGTGPLLDDRNVRRIILLKVNTLATGYSGVGRALPEALLEIHNKGVLPCIPVKGSVGASGDLAPLAHLAAALIGEGSVRVEGQLVSAAAGLAQAGLEPLSLLPKEGLAMVNGTQVSTSLAVAGLFAAEEVFAAALVAGSLSVEAALGQEMAFDPRIHAARGQSGQTDVAAVLQTFLANSAIRDLAHSEGRMQDPYCLRCLPQVMGACLDHLRFTAEIIGREVNAVTDNPLIFSATDDVLYGGNFHAEPIAMAADTMALALAEIGAMSERRIALLTDDNFSKLPAFLVPESGLDSGFMVAQVTAAALASENKSLAHPASVDSIPTTANHEDFVSMATFAARRLEEMADNSAAIIAIELLAACQGIEFRRPHRSSDSLEAVVAAVRERVPSYKEDRFFAPDIAAVKELVRSGWFLDWVAPVARLS